jgi:hypothetical protein
MVAEMLTIEIPIENGLDHTTVLQPIKNILKEYALHRSIDDVVVRIGSGRKNSVEICINLIGACIDASLFHKISRISPNASFIHKYKT